MTSPGSPAGDVAGSFSHWDAGLATDPFPIYEEIRESGCPVGRSDQHGGYFILTRYADIDRVARDPGTFSSHSISVPPIDANLAEHTSHPLDLDPPEHTRFRQALLPYFSPGRTRQLEPITEAAAARLAGGLAPRGRFDAAVDFAKFVPIAVVAAILGVDTRDEPLFTAWTDAIVTQGGGDLAASSRAAAESREYFAELIAARKAEPKDDLVSFLAHARIDGRPIPLGDQVGTASLLLIAGIETTWCMIGSALWYLAVDADARHRLAAEPGLIPTAVEELLRAFGPVSVVRITTGPTDLGGRNLPGGSHVLLPFVAGNRDPEAFESADEVQLDRPANRHLSFGAGVHRCLGAHLARMELRVALDQFLRKMPDFHLDGPDAVEWKAGPNRGPDRLLLAVGP